MWQTVRSAQLAPTNWAGRCLVALFLIEGGSLPSGNGQSVVSPRFEDFLVSNVYRGVAKPPDFGNRDRYQGTDLRCFGGDPMDYANKQVNFAGHLVISTCACGSGCHYLFMWDAVSGKFYHHVPPGAIDVGPYPMRGVQPPGIVYQGEQHQPNSSLLIVEGCVEDTCDCATRYYRWTGNQFQLILRQPVRMPEACLKKR
jgi:hypothetical protein